jgi:REP element-mobilizing transposase RayT
MTRRPICGCLLGTVEACLGCRAAISPSTRSSISRRAEQAGSTSSPKTERFAWVCHVICLMSTHYHAIVEAPQPRISGGMQRLNGTYARRFNRRHERRGHLFESRFVSWVVRDERHLALACRYVLNNPVRADLCRTPEDWPWSSARR